MLYNTRVMMHKYKYAGFIIESKSTVPYINGTN